MVLFGISQNSVRLFPNHIANYEFIHSHNSSDRWDVMILHRSDLNEDILNSNLKEILNQYSDKIHDKTEIWIETTTETGNLRSFLDRISDIDIDRDITFVIDAELPSDFEKNPKYKYVLGYELNFYAYFSNTTDAKISVSADNYFSRDSYGKLIENGYQTLNGSLRVERLKLFSHFIKNNLTFKNSSFYFYSNIDGSGLTFNIKGIYNELKYNPNLTEEEKSIIYDNLHMLPIKFENFNAYKNSFQHEGSTICRNSLNVILENVSNFEYDANIVTFTEKTIKPFFHGQIGLIFGIPNTMKKLEELGFDLYRDLIDYEFDEMNEPQLRWELFIKEFDRLRKLDTKKFLIDNMGRVMANKTQCTRISNLGFEKIDKLISKYRK